MENKLNCIVPLLERTEEYGRTSLELIKLKAVDKAAEVVSSFFSSGIMFLVLMMVLFVATIGVSLWLGELLGKLYYGFFCMAAFYAITWVVLFLFMRNTIKRSISNSVISKLLT
ncbi:MAG: phage holin family protein [Bacteroidota bacterium]|nr:phage holin family protein [Bacteroidota bacterium]